MSFGDGSREKWALDYQDAAPFFRQALELGITFWDTANICSFGGSEEIVGRALKEYARRDDVILATKVHQHMHDGPGGSGLSRKAIMEQIDASLTRLCTDYVDLYQIHRFDAETHVEETMEALDDVVKAGKARYLGASSMWAWQFAKMQARGRSKRLDEVRLNAGPYGVIHREEEREMFGLLADQGVDSIPWSPLAGGVVARPWGQNSTARAQDSASTDFNGRPLWLDSDQAIVDAIERIAKNRDVTMAQVAMAWVLKNPVVDAPIVGATKEHHLAVAVAALNPETHRGRGQSTPRALRTAPADVVLTQEALPNNRALASSSRRVSANVRLHATVCFLPGGRSFADTRWPGLAGPSMQWAARQTLPRARPSTVAKVHSYA
jgi:1-deoxyxylulose-5-phosphate synthase